MKTIWQGSLSFGLVSIPIHVYSAIKSHSIGFKLLCKKCHSPIVYERWCKHCNKQVAWHDIVKGLELPDGSYFITTHENLKKLKPEKTDALIITEFIDFRDIELLYTDEHFYITPAPKNEHAYILFQRALEDSAKAAIGTFTMREKEHVCAITPFHNMLLLTTLHYTYEIRKPPIELKPSLAAAKINKNELALAHELIAKSTSKKFDLSAYKDTFAQRLLAAIKASKKGKGKKVIRPEKTKAISIKKESSLESALKASLAKGKERKSR